MVAFYKQSIGLAKHKSETSYINCGYRTKREYSHNYCIDTEYKIKNAAAKAGQAN